MNKTQIAGLASAAVLVGAVSFGAVSLVNGANASAEPTPTPTAVAFDYGSIPYSNGLAAEQEAEAAAAEAARIAAEAAAAEAARVAAEQAAAAEAERIAAEQQAAAEAESFDEPADDPAPADDGIPAGAWPLAWVDDPNAADGGYWDFGACATSASTINGQPYCIP